VRVAIRVSTLLLILLWAIALVPSAFAQRHGPGEDRDTRGPGYPGGIETEQRERAVDDERALNGGNGAEADRIDANQRANGVDRDPRELGTASEIDDARRRNTPQRERRQQRACAYDGGRARSADCDYYYDDDGQYYDAEGEAMIGWTPGDPMPSESGTNRATSPGAAKLAPAAEDATASSAVVYTERFGPQGSNTLRDALIAGREHFLEKKRIYQDASAAMARAEYAEYESGRPVDPDVIAREKAARREAEVARAALAPLVEEARKQGISPDLIDLYNEQSQLD
jgi:hypothetical protein